MALFLYRLMTAAALDGGCFESVEASPRMTSQAAVTVLLASVAARLVRFNGGGRGPVVWTGPAVTGAASWICRRNISG